MKRKAGLQKKVSSIFDGVPINRNASENESGTQNQSQKADIEVKSAPTKGGQTKLEETQNIETTGTKQMAVPQKTQNKPTNPALKQKQPRKQEITSSSAVKKPQAKTSLNSGVDDGQKKFIVLIPLLLLLLGFVIFKTTYKTQAKPEVTAETEQPIDVFKVVETFKIDWAEPPELPKKNRNPMQFGNFASHSQNNNLVVSAIIYNMSKPEKSITTVNGQLMHIGDTIHGVKIVNITKNSVEFSNEEETWTQKVSSKKMQ